MLAGSGIAVRGLDLGVEFTGGRLVEYVTAAPVDPEQLRDALADAGHPRASCSRPAAPRLTVRTGSLTKAEEAEVAGWCAISRRERRRSATN